MSSVSLAENVKGDAKKFELCHRGTQEVYILQVRLFNRTLHRPHARRRDGTVQVMLWRCPRRLPAWR